MNRLLPTILVLLGSTPVLPAQTLDLLISIKGEEAGARFGSSVSAGDVNGDGYPDLIVGAPGDCVEADRSGKVYLYFGGPDMDDSADVVLAGQGVGDCFGFSLDGDGDFNGDGYCDVLIAAYGDNGRTGKAYVFLGGTSVDTMPDLMAAGENLEDRFGYAVSYAADLNSDTCDDIVIGAPGSDDGGQKAGKVYIYLGSSSIDTTVDLVLRAEGEYDYFGASVSAAGDVNGDGFDDLVVGAPTWSHPEYGFGAYPNGKAYIYFGGSPLDVIPDVEIGDTTLWLFAGGVFSGGDLNGDGYGDVLFSQHRHYYPGALYISFGASVPDSSIDLVLTGEVAYDYFGCSASAVDLNGDGFSEVVVGAKGSDQTGKVYVYLGSSAVDSLPDATLSGETPFDWFGSSICSAGDVDGDGYPDVAVGAPGNDQGGERTGKIYVYKGGELLPSASSTAIRKEKPAHISPDHPFGPAVRSTALRKTKPLAQGDPAPDSPFIEGVVSQICQSDVVSYIENLQDFRTRHTFTSRCLQASSYLYDEFQALGLPVECDDYDFFGDRFRNTVAVLPGEKTPEKIYIICGHYDSISEDDPYHHAPGADDNASGTAAVLEIASVLANYDFRSTIQFVCFSGEEEGVLGSTHCASKVAEEGINLQGVLNLDMIAFMDDEYEDLWLWSLPSSRSLADVFASAANEYTGLITYWVDWSGGDARPFEFMGYSAIMCIEYAGSYWNPYYHTSGDVLETLNPHFATEVTRATAATLIELAQLILHPPPSPALTVTPGDRSVTLNWDNSPESTIDPYSDELDFEGYRVYRSISPGFENPTLLAQYDTIDSLGYDSGLCYAYTDTGLVNGFAYWFAVTSYDNGYGFEVDEAESHFLENATLVCPSVPPSTDLERMAVVPNPYKPGASWVEMGWGEKIRFTNLPENATIRIFTLGGDLVTTLHHESSTVGSEDWYPEDIVSGIYLYSVESPIGTKVGKFVVIK